MNPQTPLEYYQEKCKKGVISFDLAQKEALEKLNLLHANLVDEYKKRSGWWHFLYSPQAVKGIYLWGSVGIGKTFLMDCFYNCLPFKQKFRIHFHRFMQNIHEQLKTYQGALDPLQSIAKQYARQTMVICFDELFVTDIADAMLLGRLFKAFFKHKICLVITSNSAPDQLYLNGLQRLQFLPAIDLLKKNTHVIHIDHLIDYRLRHLQEAGVYYTPLDQAADDQMEKTFQIFARDKPILKGPILINGRWIETVKRTTGIVWFEFEKICSIPRSQHDYLTIAEQYHTVFISHIPKINENETDTVRLFIHLIDVLYDARVKLIISAAEPVPALYCQGQLLLDYKRTHSRLIEMQSTTYFGGEE